ncbi:MAG TPA: hypothetical protein VGA20_06140 [Gemmatimonadales bacterium]
MTGPKARSGRGAAVEREPRKAWRGEAVGAAAATTAAPLPDRVNAGGGATPSLVGEPFVIADLARTMASVAYRELGGSGQLVSTYQSSIPGHQMEIVLEFASAKRGEPDPPPIELPGFHDLVSQTVWALVENARLQLRAAQAARR